MIWHLLSFGGYTLALGIFDLDVGDSILIFLAAVSLLFNETNRIQLSILSSSIRDIKLINEIKNVKQNSQ